MNLRCVQFFAAFAHIDLHRYFNRGCTAGTPSPCERCEYRQPEWRDGGWCYMFKEQVKFDCAQFSPKRGA